MKSSAALRVESLLLSEVRHAAGDSSVSSPEQEQESLHQAEQRCVQLEVQVVGLEERLEQEEGAAAQLASQRHRLEAKCCSLRRDLEELENTLTSVEKDKQVGLSALMSFFHVVNHAAVVWRISNETVLEYFRI